MSTTASGQLLREARRRAGLTQAELAARAGVVQSVVSAYESGHRQPALSTLAGLVDAAGFDLDVHVRARPSRLAGLVGPRGQVVRRRRRELLAAARRHGVTNLRVFGSVARGEDKPGSDIDLIADLPHDMSLIGLGRVIEDLEAIVGSKVDLVPAADLKAEVRRRALAEAVTL